MKSCLALLDVGGPGYSKKRGRRGKVWFTIKTMKKSKRRKINCDGKLIIVR